MLICGHHNIYFVSQALVVPEKFQHILRVLNTNIDGKQKIMFALTAIKVSRKNSYLQCISFTIRIMLLEWKPSFENFWFWDGLYVMLISSVMCASTVKPVLSSHPKGLANWVAVIHNNALVNCDISFDDTKAVR